MNSNFFDNLSAYLNIGSIIFSSIFWALLAFFIGRYAERCGENKTLHMVLVFFGQLIGLAVSLILISSKKNSRTNDPNGIFNNNNQGFGTYQNQQGFNQYNSATQRHICPSCGHEQVSGGFCSVCGSQIR